MTELPQARQKYQCMFLTKPLLCFHVCVSIREAEVSNVEGWYWALQTLSRCSCNSSTSECQDVRPPYPLATGLGRETKALLNFFALLQQYMNNSKIS